MRWSFLLVALIIYSIAADALLPELILDQDDRKAVQVASFGFLSGGQLSLDLGDLVVALHTHFLSNKYIKKYFVYKLSNDSDAGDVAFYIRKARQTLMDEDTRDNDDQDHGSTSEQSTCLLDRSYVKEEVDDGTSIVENLSTQEHTWQTTIRVQPHEEGLWQVIFVNCKQHSTVSFHLTVDPVNPGNNHLSAGDTPLPLVYGISSTAYLLVAFYWLSLLVFRKDTRVFRAHWLMLVLVVCIHIDKALHSAKFYYKKKGVLTEGWRIGFYIFASVKGILSILIIILLASGWMFIKPFLSAKDKRVISIVVPLQVLANIASAIGNEAAVGSTDRSFWNMVLPLIDLAGCGVILWTILQTRKHLGRGTSADGKETDVLNKYKLWSSFYIVTLVYIYVTRIIVQLLQASLPFQYVTWLGEAVDETATFLFYVFIGYKFRPYPNNPYTQVPDDDDDDIETRASGSPGNEDTMRLYPVARGRSTAESNESLT